MEADDAGASGGPGYSRPAKAFHWAMAALIVGTWLIGFYAAHLRPETVKTSITIHKALASTIIFIAAARVLYRLTHVYPALPPHVSGPMAWAAKGTHVLLYAVAMIAAPLSGWYWSSVGGYPIPVLGLFDLPPIAHKDPGWYGLGMWAHRAFVWTAGGLIALHVLAALKHHLIDRDDVLSRMLPRRPRMPSAREAGHPAPSTHPLPRA